MQNDIKPLLVSCHLRHFTLCWLVSSNCALITLLQTPMLRSVLCGQEFGLKYLYMHSKLDYCRDRAKDLICMLGLFEGCETTANITAPLCQVSD